jgi:hypothetical protein
MLSHNRYLGGGRCASVDRQLRGRKTITRKPDHYEDNLGTFSSKVYSKHKTD